MGMGSCYGVMLWGHAPILWVFILYFIKQNKAIALLIYNNNIYRNYNMDLVFPIPELNDIKELRPYMLLKSNIPDFNKTKENKDKKDKKVDDCFADMMKIKESVSKMGLQNKRKKIVIDSTDYFWPREKDQLFWCFYAVLYDRSSYFDNKLKTFSIEHDFKIASVEKLRKMKDQMKIHKIRRNQVEDELVNEKRITPMALNALCLLYRKNVILVKGRTYTLFCHDLDNSVHNLTNYDVIFRKDDIFYLDYDLTDARFQEIISTYYRVDDLEKPLKSVSSYKADELRLIAESLSVELIDPVSQKNKTKTKLYEHILEKLV